VLLALESHQAGPDASGEDRCLLVCLVESPPDQRSSPSWMHARSFALNQKKWTFLMLSTSMQFSNMISSDALQLGLVLCTMSALVISTAWLRRRRHLAGQRGPHCLSNSSETKNFKLVRRDRVNRNVYVFRFELPDPSTVLGLPIGRHVSLSALIPNPLTGSDHKHISRQYTPISSDFHDMGYFDLLVRVYRKNEHPNFPEGGWMSQYLETLSLGSEVEFRGPCGRIEYLESGCFKLGNSKRSFKRVGMIAGGTGITPMYQLIKHVLVTRAGVDKLKLSLLFGNQSPDDILLRDELESLACGNPEQLKLSLTVDRVPGDASNWTGFTGFVTKEMIEKTMPSPAKDVLILLCGPPPMTKSVSASLVDLGYTKENISVF
jgi:NAD(P)H-flavin reductase